MKKITAVLLCLIMAAVLAIPACAAGGTDDVLKESVIAAERSRGRYYYNYLGRMKNGAAYQELYDKLYDFSLRLIESDMDFETDGYALIFNAGSPVIWEYDAGKLSYNEVLSVTNLFADDNPYFYFMEIMLTGTDLKLFPNYSFEKAAERKETFRNINSYLESYSEAEKIHDLYEKALFLHDRVCLNMRYSYDLSLHPGYTGWETNIYGPVMYRTGVCNGYAHIFCLVAQYYGFECPMIWGLRRERCERSLIP